MRDARRAALALVASLALVALLVACGGGGSDGSTEGSTAAGGGAASETGSYQPNRSQEDATSDGGAGAGADAGGTAKVSHAAARKHATHEHKRYGRPSKRSAPFVTAARRGTLKHVAEFGDEGGSDQREEVQSLLAAYLAAVEEKDWQGACERLLPYFVSTLGTTSAPSGGCPEAIAPLIEEVVAGGHAWPLDTAPVVASLRVEPYPPERNKELGLEIESSGFALLRGPEGDDYYAVLSREARQWRLTSLLPVPLS